MRRPERDALAIERRGDRLCAHAFGEVTEDPANDQRLRLVDLNLAGAAFIGGPIAERTPASRLRVTRQDLEAASRAPANLTSILFGHRAADRSHDDGGLLTRIQVVSDYRHAQV